MGASAIRRPRRSDVVTMRVPRQTKELLERAASSVNKSLSAFVLESAIDRAQAVLLDQTMFVLSADAFEALARILNDPPPPTEKLKALMQQSPPWES